MHLRSGKDHKEDCAEVAVPGLQARHTAPHQGSIALHLLPP
jgi:hypothetical protein